MNEEGYQFLLITQGDWKNTLLRYPSILKLSLLNFDLETENGIIRYIMLTADQKDELKKYDIPFNLITITKNNTLLSQLGGNNHDADSSEKNNSTTVDHPNPEDSDQQNKTDNITIEQKEKVTQLSNSEPTEISEKQNITSDSIETSSAPIEQQSSTTDPEVKSEDTKEPEGKMEKSNTIEKSEEQTKKTNLLVGGNTTNKIFLKNTQKNKNINNKTLKKNLCS